MRVWLVTVGEPIPSLSGSGRSLRTGTLARQLAEWGHDVVWWTSTVDHFEKRQMAGRNTRHEVPTTGESYAIHLVHGLLYRRNVSILRLLHNVHTARNFRRWIEDLAPPDVILASLPTVELCLEAVAYGEARGVPVVVDVRDLWPSIWVDRVAGWLRPLGRRVVSPWVRRTRSVLRRATMVTAVSQTYLQWALDQGELEPDPHRQRVVSLGYEPPRCTPEAVDSAREGLRASGVDPARPIAWFVGSFGVSYDLLTVVEAARLMARGACPVQFVISGRGEKEAELRRRAEGLDNLVLTGWVGSGQIAALLEWAWVGLAAYAESAPQVMPNKIFEYMAGGLPLVHSLQGETREILGRFGCGIFYPPGDAGALAATLTDLHRHPRRRDVLAAASLRAFHEHYSVDSILEKMTAALQDAVDGSDPA